VVLPSGNEKPEGGDVTTVTLEQLSVADGEKVTTALQLPESGRRTMADMGVRTGLVLSRTVTVCVPVVTFPVASVATKEIVVVPTGKRLPAGTPDLWIVTGEQLSKALAVPSAASGTTTLHVVAVDPVTELTAGGTDRVGGVPSVTTTSCVPSE